ncbi:MAG: hypothetical protein HY079_07825, partial [Elusimicrobia bacterium]|nr:hypothetical protein [Elusimicrobiota bacterium]
MKRLLCAAAVLATALALARADEGAYRSLVGMASVAGSDRRAEDAAVLDGARSTVSARGASASDAAGGTALADTLRDALAEPP